MGLRRSRTVLRHRTGRAAGALTVVAVTAFSPGGGGFLPVAHAQAIGTVVGGSITSVADQVPVITPDGGLVVTGSAPLVSPGEDSVTAVETPTFPTITATDPATATATGSIVAPSAPTGAGIPTTVLAAYKRAETSMAASDPACHLSWTLLAGIGRVESGHASGGRVDASGTTNGRILGPRLDGTNSTVVIHDTDGGALDGDTVFDRAVGPMQFIPGTWKAWGRDGNGDGVSSPHNVFDAAAAAGAYLCAGGSDLSQPLPIRAALLRYNRSTAYGELVLRWAVAYAAGVSVLPNGTGEVPTTTPTPPAQVPAPATGTLDPATSAALAAPAPEVKGSVASESSADSKKKTTTTTTTITTTTTPTSTTSTTTPTTTTSPSGTTTSSEVETSTSSSTTSTTTSTTTSSATSSTVTTTPETTSSTVTSTSTAAGSGTSDPSSKTSTKTSTGTGTTGSSATKTSTSKAASTKTSTIASKAVTSSAAKVTTTTATG